MVSFLRLGNARVFADFGVNVRLIRVVFHSSGCPHDLSLNTRLEIDRITKVINDHPFPDVPIQPALSYHISPPTLSIALVENVLGRLFSSHANGLKAYEFFQYCFKFSKLIPSSCVVERTLHILARMGYLDKAWEFMGEICKKDSSLLTLKAMSIMLSRIAKSKSSYEETLEAFNRMEKSIFVCRNFGTDEFNVLLRAFCTHKKMKEAKSVFQKLHSRFSPNIKTMNILLLGFKESGPLTAVDLFYYEMTRRGFKPNIVTYNIRIDAYCKYGSLGDGLRLLKEMDGLDNCSPTLETITTLIHGAGIARNKAKAWDLFHDLSKRNINPDIGVYNALISTLVKCKDVASTLLLIDEPEKRCIALDNMTYHTLFYGLMRTEGMEGVLKLFGRMTRKNFVPKTRTVVMLMKFFCLHRRIDLGLQLWEYLLDRGSCPHEHALALLVSSFCSEGRWQEAFECSKQMLARGRHLSDPVFRMLERPLLEAGEEDKVKVLSEMMQKLKNYCPT